MAKGQTSTETQGQQQQGQGQQGRSVARREDYFPNFGGDLFSSSPFALLREMTNWMDRGWSGAYGSPSRTEPGRSMRQWSPAIEVQEKDNNLIVRADLPGVDQNDVKIEVDNNMLVIQGERKQEHTEDREGWHRSERSYGSFYRTIPLPETAKADDAKAEYKNGVLEITIPVEQPKSNRRQIQINK